MEEQGLNRVMTSSNDDVLAQRNQGHRRKDTGIPLNVAYLDDEGRLGRSRDEFEMDFFGDLDAEQGHIADVLHEVKFHHLRDDEEEFSEEEGRNDTQQKARRRAAYSRPTSTDSEFDKIDLVRPKSSDKRDVEWARTSTEVGCADCEGCMRLKVENKRLRRCLDDLEFEMATKSLPRSATDSQMHQYSANELASLKELGNKAHSTLSRMNQRQGHVASPPKSRRFRSSERARLRSEIQALTVTTEYLWRKLNTAESELRIIRGKFVRERMMANSLSQMVPDCDYKQHRTDFHSR